MYYTDSNGREFQTRQRDFRPTWKLNVTEPVAGNYYPVTAGAYIRDANMQFSVLNDRSQGGASINDGQFELMIHRRLLYDDHRGVGEPLNETDGITPYPDPVRIGDGLHVTGSHYVYMSDPKEAAMLYRDLQARVYHVPVLGFSPLTGTVQSWIQANKVQKTWMTADLPINVDLMTLQVLENGNNLLRLSHQFAVGEDPTYSAPATVDVLKLFNLPVPITACKEVSLTTNQDVSNMKQLKWQTTEPNSRNLQAREIVPFDGQSVTINPMDIRTFLCGK